MRKWKKLRNQANGSTEKHFRKTCTHKYLLHLEKPQQQEVLIVFASRFRAGEFGNGKEVRVVSVDVALQAVAQTIVMAGNPDPRRTYNQKELDPPFHDLLASYKNEDPRLQPELSVPVEVVAPEILQDGTEKSRTIRYLVELQFFFLIRVGEYTFPINKKQRTRTVQFIRKDVMFSKGARNI